MYEIRFTKKSLKDLALIQRGRKSILKKIEGLLDVIELNPYQNPPPYAKLAL